MIADATTRLLACLALMLALSHWAGRLATRFGQPAVLAELAAGVALGPTLLGRSWPSAHRWLFGPGTLPVVNGLGQLAVALYAFGIGAQLAAAWHAGPQPRTSPLGTPGGAARRGVGPGVVALAAVSVAVPGVVGVLLGPWLHRQPGLAGTRGDLASFTAFVACALGVTAVPVLARIVQDRGLDSTRAGRLSLAAAAIGDGACWCLLALALWLGGRIETTGLVLGVAGAVAAVLAVRHRASASIGRGRPAEPAALLALVLALAAFSALLGLHPLLGGLLAGVVWGPGTADAGGEGRPAGADAPSSGDGGFGGDRRRAARQIDVVARALLPCFFLAAGQQVDLGSAPGRGAPALVAGLCLVSVVSKAPVCAAVARWRAGLGRRESVRVGVLMSTKGLTEIVVLTSGFQAGLVGRRFFEVLLVVTLLVTTAVGPGLRLVDFAHSPAGAAPRVK